MGRLDDDREFTGDTLVSYEEAEAALEKMSPINRLNDHQLREAFREAPVYDNAYGMVKARREEAIRDIERERAEKPKPEPVEPEGVAAATPEPKPEATTEPKPESTEGMRDGRSD